MARVANRIRIAKPELAQDLLKECDELTAIMTAARSTAIKNQTSQ